MQAKIYRVRVILKTFYGASMLSIEAASVVIDYGVLMGADFVELFVEKNLASAVNLLNSDVDSVRSGIDFGIGIRLIFGEKVLYAYSNDTETHQLCQIIRRLASAG